MKKRNPIVTFDPEAPLGKSLADGGWLDKATDADIDFSDIPPLGEDFFKNAALRMPRTKKMVSIRLDEDLIDWYKRHGPGYQTRINAVLKAFMMASQEVQASHDIDEVSKAGRTGARFARDPHGRTGARFARDPHGRKVLKAPKAPKDPNVPKASKTAKTLKDRHIPKITAGRLNERRHTPQAPKTRAATR